MNEPKSAKKQNGHQVDGGSRVGIEKPGQIVARPVVVVRPALDATEHVIESVLRCCRNRPRIFDHPVWDLGTQLRRDIAAPQQSNQ